MMEAWIWIFFIFSLFSTLAKHSCQVTPDHSTESLNNPIIILPASSGISYESLHYPVPAEQQHQVIPLVINTGKIPLINHAVQAPIQYFVPNSENRRSPIYESTQYLLARDKRVQPNTETMLYSNDEEIQNRPTYDHNDPPIGTATIYSETRVSGQPASQGYSYGYKIIRGHVGDSNDRHEVPSIVDDDGPSSHHNISRPHETDRMLEHITIDPSAKLQEANTERKTDKSKPRYNKPDNISRTFKPIVVKTELNATETELKKYYKKVKNTETPTNKAPNTGEKLTTINPVQQ